MKHASLRASKEHKTIAAFRIACIQENGLPLSTLKRYLSEYFHFPENAIDEWADDKSEASFEGLAILTRIEKETANHKDKIYMIIEINMKIEKEIRRVKRFCNLYDTVAVNEPCPEQSIEYVHSYYEGPNDSYLADYADKHGV